MAAAAPLAMAAPAPTVKLGIDLFSLRSQNWTPFQLLDYSAKLAANGGFARHSTPDELIAFVQSEQKTWRPILQQLASDTPK